MSVQEKDAREKGGRERDSVAVHKRGGEKEKERRMERLETAAEEKRGE